MSPSKNKAVARGFIQAWSPEGIGVIDELAAPDMVVSYSHFPEPIRGAESLKQMLKQTFSCFPDLRITAEEIMVR